MASYFPLMLKWVGFLHLCFCWLIDPFFSGGRFSSRKAAVMIEDGFLQLVPCWLVAQTGLTPQGVFVMFGLSKLLFYHICTMFSLSFFGVRQFLICHFNGLCAQRLSSGL